MSSVEQTVYTGKDNSVDLQLTEDGVAIPDHSVITGMTLSIEGVADITHTDHPTYFDFTYADRVILMLGQAGIPAGIHWMQMTVITQAAPNGIVWQPKVKLRVE